MIKKYRKKPIVVEAVKLTGEDSNIREVVEFLNNKSKLSVDKNFETRDRFSTYCDMVRRDGMKIATKEGVMTADIGDFIIKGIEGEFYPCKPEIFKKTYKEI